MDSLKYKILPVLLLGVLLNGLFAAEHLVISNGKTKKYSTPAKALAEAKSGDTVVIDNGFWQGGLNLSVPGVTLKGRNSTVICAGREVAPSAWAPAPEAGKNAWSVSWAKTPSNVVCNGRLLLELNANNGLGTLAYREIMKYGVNSSGRKLLGGIYSYDRKNKRLTVSLPDVNDITQCRIFVSGRGKDAITIAADNCKVSNLIVLGGEAGVAFRKCKGSSVHNVLALANNNGILFTDGCSNCEAHHCDVILNPDSFSCNAAIGTSSAIWDVWLAHKRVGSWDKTGIALFWAGRGNRVYSNFVYNHWNGIHCGTNPKTWNKGLKEYYHNNIKPQKGRVNQETLVFNNRVDLCVDDGLEPAGDTQNQQWHSNKVTRAHCGIRIKTIDIGPLYIYDNDVSMCLDGIRFFKTITEPAQVYVVHNRLAHRAAHTFASVENPPLKGVFGKQIPGGVRGGHIHNNLYLTDAYTLTLPPAGTALFSASNNAYMCKRPEEIPTDIEKESRFELKLTAEQNNCSEVKAKMLRHEELPAKERSKYAGLLNIARERTPDGFISGLHAQAEKLFDMKIRDWKFSEPLNFRRFVMGPKQNYVIETTAPMKQTKILLRKYLGSKFNKSAVKAVFTDEGGKLLKETVLKPLAVQEIDVPMSGNKRVIMSLISTWQKASWSVENLDPHTICRLRLDEEIFVTAYHDVSPIEITTEVKAQDKELGISVTTTAEQKNITWIRPDGKKLPVPQDGKLNVAGHPGVWKLHITNAARIKLTPSKDSIPPELTIPLQDVRSTITPRPAPAGIPY